MGNWETARTHMAVNRAVDALLRMRAAISRTLGDPAGGTGDDDFESKWGPALDEIAKLSEVQRAAVWVLCLDALERRPPMRDPKVYGGDGSKWLDTCRRQLWCLFQCATKAPEKAIEPYFAGGGGGGGVVTTHATAAPSDPVTEFTADEETKDTEEEEEEGIVITDFDDQYMYQHEPTRRRPESTDIAFQEENNEVLTQPIDNTDFNKWILIETDKRYGPDFARKQQSDLEPMLKFFAYRAALEEGTRIAALLPETALEDLIRDGRFAWFYKHGPPGVDKVPRIYANPTIVQCIFQLGPSNEGEYQGIATEIFRHVMKNKAINATVFCLVYQFHVVTVQKALKEKLASIPPELKPFTEDQIIDERLEWDTFPENETMVHFVQSFSTKVHRFGSFLSHIAGIVLKKLHDNKVWREVSANWTPGENMMTRSRTPSSAELSSKTPRVMYFNPQNPLEKLLLKLTNV